MVAPGTIIAPALAFVYVCYNTSWSFRLADCCILIFRSFCKCDNIRRPDTDEELVYQDAQPPSPAEAELIDPGSPLNTEIHPMYCNWEACHLGFWELEDMVQHLNDMHIGPQNSKKPLCDWVDCPRKGKQQTSRFALLAHLRSHTGEKPFICPRPGMFIANFHSYSLRHYVTLILITILGALLECDKSFTRTDALQKHMRVQHHENLPPTRKPPTKKPKLECDANAASDLNSELGVNAPPLAEEVLDSSTAMYDPALLAYGTPIPSAPIASGSATPRTVTPLQFNTFAVQPTAPGSHQDEEEEDVDSPEIQQAISANLNLPADQVRYLCMLARHHLASQDRENLSVELKALSKKEEMLLLDKEGMLDIIFRTEIGLQAESIIEPVKDQDIPILRWSLVNRTSLPNFVRDTKDDAKQRAPGGGDDDDE